MAGNELGALLVGGRAEEERLVLLWLVCGLVWLARWRLDSRLARKPIFVLSLAQKLIGSLRVTERTVNSDIVCRWGFISFHSMKYAQVRFSVCSSFIFAGFSS